MRHLAAEHGLEELQAGPARHVSCLARADRARNGCADRLRGLPGGERLRGGVGVRKERRRACVKVISYA